MKKDELQIALESAQHVVRMIERLVPPKGSIPASGCPTRGAGGEQDAVTISDTASPLPDQGWGAKWHPACQPPDEETTVIVATTTGEVDAGFLDEGVWRWASADRIGDGVTHWMPFPEAPLTQSGAHGDEVEAAILKAMECLNFTAAAVDRAADAQDEMGIAAGCESSRNKAADYRHAYGVLESLLPELSRKERSVSGNA